MHETEDGAGREAALLGGREQAGPDGDARGGKDGRETDRAAPKGGADGL